MSLVRVQGWRGGIASVDREKIGADERRWVRVTMFGYPHETRWVPKDTTDPFVIEITKEFAKALEALRPKEDD